MIQFIRGKDRAKSEIATLQSGQAPPNDPDNIGSHNFSKIPVAAIFGRGADPKDIEEIRQACGGEDSKLAWLQSKPAPAAAMKASPPDLNDPVAKEFYAKKAAEVMKLLLNELSEKGLLGVDGSHQY